MKKILSLSTLSSLIIGLAVVNASATPVTWSANGHQYELVSGPTWTAAENAAIALGGHLVTINSAEEQTWLNTQFASNGYLWIGFNDIASEGTWVWSSGEAVTYTNWSGGEPNNYGNEDVAIMFWYNKWNDLPLNDTTYASFGVAEYTVSQNAVPEPGTLSLLTVGMLSLAGIARRKNNSK